MPTITKSIKAGCETRIVWDIDSQNIPNNTSIVTVKVQLVSTDSLSTISETAIKYGSLTIDGETNNFTFSAVLSGNQIKTVYTKTVIIPHNEDGTKICAFSASIGIALALSGTYYGIINISGSGAFTTIPRPSSISLSASSVEMGNTLTINISRSASSLTHRLTYRFGDISGTIAESADESAAWTIPLDLAEAVPNSVTGIGKITCETLSGSTVIGSKSVNFTATVPASVVPTISAVSISEAVTGIASQFGGYVQNKSKLSVSVSASGAYGSSVIRYKTTIQGVEYSGAEFVSNALTVSGTFSIQVIITDSRGRTGQFSKSLTAIQYSSPTVNAFSAYRCNSDGSENEEGKCLNLNINFSILAANNKNAKSYKVEYKLKSADTWTALLNGSVYTFNENVVTSSIFDINNAYDLRLTVTDYFGSAVSFIDIPTGFTLIDFRSSGKGIAFGKASEADRMEIALNLELTGKFLQESIISPILKNSWTNYSTAYQGAGYWKDKCDVVHLCGLIKGGTTVSDTVIFTLPLGYRPALPEKFLAVSNNAICVIDVRATGDVVIKTGANSSMLSLSGITFKST